MKTLSPYTVLLLFFAATFLCACSLDKLSEEIKPSANAISSNAGRPYLALECVNVFEGTCLGGKQLSVPFGAINTPEDIPIFCNDLYYDQKLKCPVNECTDRLTRIFYGPYTATGNPCTTKN